MITLDNQGRAEKASQTLKHFAKLVKGDEGDAHIDLLANLFHWCDANDININGALVLARMHYDEECEDEEQTPQDIGLYG